MSQLLPTRVLRTAFLLSACAGVLACGRPTPRVLTVVGTSDLHGHLEGDGNAGGVALLGGYLGVLRRLHPVVLVDAGDMFQGTLVSNLREGAPVVRAMNVLGYQAAAIGNHEFDYGPVGEASVAQRSDEDPRGALKARAREAQFPLLAANVIDESTGAPVAWPGFRTAVQIEVNGVKVGLTGGVTRTTPSTTSVMNLRGLRFEPLPSAIRAQAEALRRAGAEVVVASVHAGGRCRVLDHPDDTSSCEGRSELFELARSLPPGLVDVIVGGHTHNVVAHRVAGIALIESLSRGQAFGRVDLELDPQRHRAVASRIFPPHKMIAGEQYEGSRIQPDPRVAATFAEDVARVSALRARALGVEVADRMWPSQTEESPLGNWVADLLRKAMPAADFAIYNGGGLRAELRAGALTFGALYEVLPFDNRLAMMTMRGATLKRLLMANYQGRIHGILSLAGLHATLRCPPGDASPELMLTTTSGVPLDDRASYRVVTSDFLATGGDDFAAALGEPGTAVQISWDRPPIHDVVADELERRGGTVRLADVYDRAHPRLSLSGCGRTR